MDLIWPSTNETTNVNESASARFLIFNSSQFGCINGHVWKRARLLRSPQKQKFAHSQQRTSVQSLCRGVSQMSLFLSSINRRREACGNLSVLRSALFTCVQFLTLVLISTDRYQAVAFPFKNRNERIRIWILFLWVCGLFFAILSLTLCDDFVCYMTCRHLRKFSPSRADPFGVYVLVPGAFLWFWLSFTTSASLSCCETAYS